MMKILRPIIKDDLLLLNKWKNDKEIYQFLGGGYQPTSINTQEKWIDNLIDTTGINKRFIVLLEGKAVGLIGLYSINWINRTCEIGLFIGEKESHSKGIGTKAYLELEKFAKESLNLRKINLNVVETNINAVNFWLKMGFVQVGILSKERYINNKYHNLLIMEKFIEGK